MEYIIEVAVLIAYCHLADIIAVYIRFICNSGLVCALARYTYSNAKILLVNMLFYYEIEILGVCGVLR
jgi:hypothetical protein